MRFFLDHDVSALVCQMLATKGHKCWSANEAGTALARDNDHTAYAMDKDAALLTHDVAFTARRKKSALGRHIQLRCSEPEAPSILERHLDDLVPILYKYEDVTIVVHASGFELYRDWDGAPWELAAGRHVRGH